MFVASEIMTHGIAGSINTTIPSTSKAVGSVSCPLRLPVKQPTLKYAQGVGFLQVQSFRIRRAAGAPHNSRRHPHRKRRV